MLRKVAAAALIVGVVLFAWRWASLTAASTEMPVERLRDAAARGPVSYLTAPLPDWVPLPGAGRVVTASAAPPQPPYGSSVTLILAIDETAEAFAAAYAARLAAAGYAVRRVPAPFDFSFTGELALDAYDAKTGRYVVCVLRRAGSARTAQITFWDAPAPRL
jgi:hypothetical protein